MVVGLITRFMIPTWPLRPRRAYNRDYPRRRARGRPADAQPVTLQPKLAVVQAKVAAKPAPAPGARTAGGSAFVCTNADGSRPAVGTRVNRIGGGRGTVWEAQIAGRSIRHDDEDGPQHAEHHGNKPCLHRVHLFM